MGAILLPYELGQLLVRSRRVPLRRAINLLTPPDMDLGRYVDLIMNLSLCCFAGFVQVLNEARQQREIDEAPSVEARPRMRDVHSAEYKKALTANEDYTGMQLEK